MFLLNFKWRRLWLQTLAVDGKELYKHVLETSKTWKNSENLMYVGCNQSRIFHRNVKLFQIVSC
jgi:hypothetical protein